MYAIIPCRYISFLLYVIFHLSIVSRYIMENGQSKYPRSICIIAALRSCIAEHMSWILINETFYDKYNGLIFTTTINISILRYEKIFKEMQLATVGSSRRALGFYMECLGTDYSIFFFFFRVAFANNPRPILSRIQRTILYYNSSLTEIPRNAWISHG